MFQGEGGTLESLLANTASVTSTLAERDEVISSLIDNLNVVLDNLGDRDEQLSELIVTFKTFVGGLKDDRDAILDSLDQISALSVQTADLVKGIRSPFVEDIKQLRRLTKNINAQQGRAGPGAAGAADQAREGRPDRDLRLVLQLLPVQLPGQGPLPRRRDRPGELRHRHSQV